MSAPSEVICRPTKWFFWRALLMLVMFGGFGAYFLYDWKIGYPEKNYVVANYKAFTQAGQDWTKEELREGNWKEHVASQTIPFGDEKSIYPPGTDFEEPWPEILAGMEKGENEELWLDYSEEKGWPSNIDVDEDPKDAYKIKEQLIAAMVCFVLTAIALFFLLRTRGRVMKADDEAYYPPGKKPIPYSQMIQLDKRKWETKGLATLTYREGEKEKKAKIDGMVYGQFKAEDGAPAEALFQKVLSNFEGELIELVDEDDEDEDEAEEPDVEEAEASEIDSGSDES